MEFFGKSQTAKDETNKKTATEIMNLKITNAQIQSYAERQEMPTLQYLADRLCEDNEIQYVELSSKKTAELDKITVVNGKSIFAKLKEYPYEFEIDGKLKLASINGIKVADNTVDEEKEELKTAVETLQTTITQLQTKIENLEKEQKKTNNDYTSSLNQEKLIGKWYDGSEMYELTLPITLPSATAEKYMVWNKINLQQYNIKECIIENGYYICTNAKTMCPMPMWASQDNSYARIVYQYDNKELWVGNSWPNIIMIVKGI